jgi:class 3 adenylate cyclase
VLFTDVVDSTALRSRLGEEAADDLRRTHDEVVTEAIESNAGRVVKLLGDGVMAVFESAADAVAAAVAAQQTLTAAGDRLPEPVTIRVGISVGDVSLEDGDCFGTAVNEAARLCGAAQGGQILVADLVRALARGRGAFTFESFGSLELKGLTEPVPTCSVGWDPLPPNRDERVPFPPALVPGTGGPYVGRPDVLGQVGALWEDTKLEGCRTALLVGEPGIGKTRTSYEVAKTARDAGAVVLFGRCDDELKVPYQPFVEALDWQLRHAPDLPLGRLAGELARLVPDLGERVEGVGAPVTSDPRTEEHRLFEAVASWVTAVARETGLVIVVDDLHWATKPTLLMLLHTIRAAQSLDDGRLLVIGTYRDTDVDRSHPLHAVLGDLQRVGAVHRIAVDPLDQYEVIELVEQAAGHELDEVTRAVAARTHAETDGNPFFVAEVLRHLIESGGVRFVDGRWIVPDPDAIHVPEGVRDVVGQRLSRLSGTANDVLRAASVIGREFDLDVVGELVGVDEDPLLDAVDEAVRARLIEEVDADRFRFAHALVRTSLYEELSASRRRRMHRRVTELVSKHSPDDIAALAHHSVEAGPRGGDLSEAIGYVLAAADHALATRALGEAESLYGKALELLEEDDALPDDHRALQARCGIGEVLRDQGDPSFREVLLGVSAAATEAGGDGLLIRSAIANNRGLVSSVGSADPERIEHLESALAVAPEGTDRARVQALLASELTFVRERRAERLGLVDAAIAGVDGCRDDLAVAWVLGIASIPGLVPERWVDGLEVRQRCVEAADRSGDPNLRALARLELGWALLSRGEVVQAARTVREGREIALTDAGPITQWAMRSQSTQYLLIEGDIEGAAAENDAAFELGLEIGAVDADAWWGAGAALITFYRDDQMGDPDLTALLADRYPLSPTWRGVQAWALAERGRLDECRALVAEHGLDRPAGLSHDVFWFTTLYTLSQVARHLEDADLAGALLPEVEPYRDHFTHYCIGAQGPVRRMLGYIRPLLGDLDGGIDDARASLAWALDMGYPVPIAAYRIELAELLVERGRQGDGPEAYELLQTARADAERLGMHGWRVRADTLLAAPGWR